MVNRSKEHAKAAAAAGRKALAAADFRAAHERFRTLDAFFEEVDGVLQESAEAPPATREPLGLEPPALGR